MSFYGADSMVQQKDLCNQYETRLDIYALGVMALELLCTSALATDDGSGKVDGLRGSWRRLLTAWSKYREDVTRWHTQIYKVFAVGGDIGPLYQELARENVVDKVLSRVTDVRACLRACIERSTDPSIQALLLVVGEMLSESSSSSLAEAVQALGSGDAVSACPAEAQSQARVVTSLPAQRQAPPSAAVPQCSARQQLHFCAAMPRSHSPTPTLASGPGYLSHRPALAHEGRRTETAHQDASAPSKNIVRTARPMCGGA